MKKIIREYRLELVVLLAACIVGLFLLIDQRVLFGAVRQGMQRFIDFLSRLLHSLAVFLSGFSLEDAIGFVLIILFVFFIVWRVRYRFFVSDRWRANRCPKCDSEIYRIPRSSFDRFLSRLFLPYAGRYKCSNSKCNWSGLRRRPSHKHRDQFA